MTTGPEELTPPLGAPSRASWAYASQYDDIDAQAAHFQGFGQHYEQLSAGPFRGQFESYQFGRELTVHLERANRELMQSASTPSDRFGFSFLLPESPPCVLNAHRVADGDIILYPADAMIEGRTPAGMRIFCVDLDAELLNDYGLEQREIRVVHDPERADALRDTIVAGIAAFRQLGEPAAYRAAAGDFCSSLSELVWQLASADGSDAARTRSRGRRQAFVVYRRARDVFIERLALGVSIAQVCREVGVSRRSLECAFRTAVGLSPAHYVRKLQLNQVRRDLLAAADGTASIGGVAARHGLWHWSRFSQSYREMFGELPSATRRRARSGLSA